MKKTKTFLKFVEERNKLADLELQMEIAGPH